MPSIHLRSKSVTGHGILRLYGRQALVECNSIRWLLCMPVHFPLQIEKPLYELFMMSFKQDDRKCVS